MQSIQPSSFRKNRLFGPRSAERISVSVGVNKAQMNSSNSEQLKFSRNWDLSFELLIYNQLLSSFARAKCFWKNYNFSENIQPFVQTGRKFLSWVLSWNFCSFLNSQFVHFLYFCELILNNYSQSLQLDFS